MRPFSTPDNLEFKFLNFCLIILGPRPPFGFCIVNAYHIIIKKNEKLNLDSKRNSIFLKTRLHANTNEINITMVIEVQ